ncbi:UDP-2,3-diacylglucosamine diphosphatase [Salipiger sp.]|uniref:UDP-2,3-diacylglucosamine diphosphatase n=1 Tax=Salipiger sp. TaxID=2078585 RepID=UPI003A98749E
MPSSPAGTAARQFYRSLFLSDFHLGARASRPEAILAFLNRVEADTIYLVGDIFDLWHGGKVHWSDGHQAVLDDLRGRAGRGTRIVYLPGNHDARMRKSRLISQPWEFRNTTVHHAADGRAYLVLHGDQCDPRILRWHLMTRLGSRLDGLLRQIDGWLTRPDAPRGSKSAVQRVIAGANQLMAMGDRFEIRLTDLARAAGTSGVICGHSHRPALRDRDGVTFANCGDWVDSLTALAEDRSGRMRLIDFAAETARAGQRPAGLRPASEEDGSFAGEMA